MKQSQIAAQLYSFREFIRTPAGVRDTFRRLREIGYEAVQLSSSLAPMPEEELAAMLAEAGLAAPTSHESAASLIDQPDQVIEKLHKLQVKHTAYPFPHWRPTGRAEAVELARQLNGAARRYRDAGITLAYHNHSVEFERFEGRAMLELIYENAPDLEAELDTYWVQKGGADPLAWIEKLPGRMQVLHVKDFGMKPHPECSGDVMKPVGEGNLDWNRLIPAAERCGVRWFVVEHDGDCADPFESFHSSFAYLKRNFVR